MNDPVRDEFDEKLEAEREERQRFRDEARATLSEFSGDADVPALFRLDGATVRGFRHGDGHVDTVEVQAYRDEGLIDPSGPLTIPHLHLDCFEVDGMGSSFIQAGYRPDDMQGDLVSLHIDEDGSLYVSVLIDPATGDSRRLRWEELRDRVMDLPAIRQLPTTVGVPSPAPRALPRRN